jgi:membrane-bound metal-dependent hydrolase YbcI (DUF457 family)
MIPASIHLAAVALLCLVAGPIPPAIFLAALLLGLLPDIDTPRSLLGNLLRPLSTVIEGRYGHRTITHSLAALLLVAGVAYLLTSSFWLVLAGAYASHLLVDLLIGASGIALCWPARMWLTIAAWREDGSAPRALLVTLLIVIAGITIWPSLAPALTPQVTAALNPIATPRPAPPTHTPVPAITLRFALPAGISLSALRVRTGDTLAEGQLLAGWEPPACTGAPPCAPWPSPTAPPPSAIHAASRHARADHPRVTLECGNDS